MTKKRNKNDSKESIKEKIHVPHTVNSSDDALKAVGDILNNLDDHPKAKVFFDDADKKNEKHDKFDSTDDLDDFEEVDDSRYISDEDVLYTPHGSIETSSDLNIIDVTSDYFQDYSLLNPRSIFHFRTSKEDVERDKQSCIRSMKNITFRDKLSKELMEKFIESFEALSIQKGITFREILIDKLVFGNHIDVFYALKSTAIDAVENIYKYDNPFTVLNETLRIRSQIGDLDYIYSLKKVILDLYNNLPKPDEETKKHCRLTEYDTPKLSWDETGEIRNTLKLNILSISALNSFPKATFNGKCFLSKTFKYSVYNIFNRVMTYIFDKESKSKRRGSNHNYFYNFAIDETYFSRRTEIRDTLSSIFILIKERLSFELNGDFDYFQKLRDWEWERYATRVESIYNILAPRFMHNDYLDRYKYQKVVIGYIKDFIENELDKDNIYLEMFKEAPNSVVLYKTILFEKYDNTELIIELIRLIKETNLPKILFAESNRFNVLILYRMAMSKKLSSKYLKILSKYVLEDNISIFNKLVSEKREINLDLYNELLTLKEPIRRTISLSLDEIESSRNKLKKTVEVIDSFIVEDETNDSAITQQKDSKKDKNTKESITLKDDVALKDVSKDISKEESEKTNTKNKEENKDTFDLVLDYILKHEKITLNEINEITSKNYTFLNLAINEINKHFYELFDDSILESFDDVAKIDEYYIDEAKEYINDKYNS